MRPPSKRSFRHKMGMDLDLTPVMGLFVALVPFLLAVAVFTKIAIITMPLPKVAQTEQEIQKVEKERFYLKVYVIDDKTRHQVREELGYVIDSNALKKGPKFLPLTSNGKYDKVGLNEVVLSIKKKNEDQKSITLIPGKFITYEVMVNTLDATRETLPELMNDPAMAGFELFPDVILDQAGG